MTGKRKSTLSRLFSNGLDIKYVLNSEKNVRWWSSGEKIAFSIDKFPWTRSCVVTFLRYFCSSTRRHQTPCNVSRGVESAVSSLAVDRGGLMRGGRRTTKVVKKKKIEKTNNNDVVFSGRQKWRKTTRLNDGGQRKKNRARTSRLVVVVRVSSDPGRNYRAAVRFHADRDTSCRNRRERDDDATVRRQKRLYCVWSRRVRENETKNKNRKKKIIIIKTLARYRYRVVKTFVVVVKTYFVVVSAGRCGSGRDTRPARYPRAHVLYDPDRGYPPRITVNPTGPCASRVHIIIVARRYRCSPAGEITAYRARGPRRLRRLRSVRAWFLPNGRRIRARTRRS